MFERFTSAARTVVSQAQDHARRLGHGYIGCEHLLLAAASAAEPASAVLREHGWAAPTNWCHWFHRSGTGPPPATPAGLERPASPAPRRYKSTDDRQQPHRLRWRLIA